MHVTAHSHHIQAMQTAAGTNNMADGGFQMVPQPPGPNPLATDPEDGQSKKHG